MSRSVRRLVAGYLAIRWWRGWAPCGALALSAGFALPALATPPPQPHADVAAAYQTSYRQGRELATRYLRAYVAQLEPPGADAAAPPATDERLRDSATGRLLHLLLFVAELEPAADDRALYTPDHPFHEEVFAALELAETAAAEIAAGTEPSVEATAAQAFRDQLLTRTVQALIAAEPDPSRAQELYRAHRDRLERLGFADATEIRAGSSASGPARPPSSRRLAAPERQEIRQLVERFWASVIARDLDGLRAVTDFDAAAGQRFLERWDTALRKEGISRAHAARFVDDLPEVMSLRPDDSGDELFTMRIDRVEIDATFEDGTRRWVETNAILYLRPAVEGPDGAGWRLTWPFEGASP